MRATMALVRAGVLTATSYRLRMLLSLASLVLTVVPIYFVAGALQPMMAESIRAQGDQYFAFLMVGMIAFAFLSTAVTALPSAIGSGISTGTLEALLATPARLPELLAGLVGYSFIWTALRAVILLVAVSLLGGSLAWNGALIATAILLILIVAYFALGILAAASVLAFRTAGPLPQGVLVFSGLLGGVYYPTHVIPSWIQNMSDVIPLTYGLRALRGVLLEGLPFSAVRSDLAILTLFAMALLSASVYILVLALQYARNSGTLSQY